VLFIDVLSYLDQISRLAGPSRDHLRLALELTTSTGTGCFTKGPYGS
jgi:hypothetical protein